VSTDNISETKPFQFLHFFHGDHFKLFIALLGSPNKVSTSVGLKYFSFILTSILPFVGS